MLNVRAVNELLAKNSDDRLCKRWFLMTLNGTLLAYTPGNIRDLRRQAAIATMTWREYRHTFHTTISDSIEEHDSAMNPDLLHTLTVESEFLNLIIRRLQPQLLLVLEGGVPPRRPAFEPRVTPETIGGTTDSAQNNGPQPKLSSSASSAAASTKSKVTSSVLTLQRTKFEALASVIAHDLENTGFRIPETPTTRIF